MCILKCMMTTLEKIGTIFQKSVIRRETEGTTTCIVTGKIRTHQSMIILKLLNSIISFLQKVLKLNYITVNNKQYTRGDKVVC